MIIHTVVPGETITSIAGMYNVNPDTLAINNGVYGDGNIAVGQAIAVVFPLAVHTVMQGETIESIARDYVVPVNRLYRNNLVLNGSPEIFEGMRLIIEIDRVPIGSYMTGGYAYPFISDPLLNVSLPAMNALMPFTYGFHPDGTLVPLDDARLVERTKSYRQSPVMHLSTLTENDVFSTELATGLFDNRSVWPVLINNVLAVLKAKGYYGLDIDFEFLGAENAARYAEFITFARETLNAQGFPVMVALAPKTSVDQPGILYEGHDYAALGRAANCVLLMTYEWGYTYGHLCCMLF